MSYLRWVMYTREGWMNQISRKCHLSRKCQSGLSNNRWFYLYIFTCVYIYIHKFVPYIHIWHFEPDSPHIAFSFTPIMIEISWISTFDNVLWQNLGRWDSTKPLRKEQNHALFHDLEDQTWYLRGFNPSEKYSWNLIISLSRGEQNSLKPHENRSGPHSWDSQRWIPTRRNDEVDQKFKPHYAPFCHGMHTTINKIRFRPNQLACPPPNRISNTWPLQICIGISWL